jgi:hypothetical protein
MKILSLKSYSISCGIRGAGHHVRDMDAIEQKRGEAAVLWFRRTLTEPDGTVLVAEEKEREFA